MKNDSKDRLEKQLNDNPELKERFVMQMSDIRDITEETRLMFKPIAESFKATTAPLEGLAESFKGLANLSSPFADIMDSLKGAPSPLADIMGSLPTFEPSQSIAESMELFNMNVKPILDSLPTLEDLEEAALLLNKIKKEYTLLRSSEAGFIEHERLFVPKDELGVYDFLDWYLYCYLFDKPFDARKDEELTLYHFNLFHTFKQRYITQKKWSVEDERKFIKELESSDSENKENVSDKPDKPKLALQWSIIFYYVEPDLYGNIEQKKNRLQAFITNFKVNKTLNSLSNKHSEIVRVVTDDEKNELKQIHISAIEKVLPFLKDNYPDAFIDADQDFKRLVDNLDRK